MRAEKATTGVLLVNMGTPEQPTPRALRRFLREFLWDPRVVEVPRFRWWLVLNLIILTTRPRRSAELYRRIWTEEGSPLLSISRRLRDAVARNVDREVGGCFEVVLGMRYGRPSIGEALDPLRRAGCSRLVCLPLYPQYSGTTTGSVFDVVVDELKTWRRVPELRTIHDYCDYPGYVDALASSVRDVWTRKGEAEKLLVSFHGIPESYSNAGDPYIEQCRRTYEGLREALGLEEERCSIAFQSRFGRDPWVGPATDDTVRGFAESGVESLDVICPGFAADCLETLDEIGREERTRFLRHGGQKFRFIPCLNDDETHAAFLSRLIALHVRGWENNTKL